MCRTVRMTGDGKDDELPPDGVRRTVMWSPPRSLSTTVERALIEHPAIHVLHEPFGLPYYWSSQAASSRESSDTRCADTYETVARRIFEDRPPEGKRFVFSKNLSYYVSPHCLPQMRELLGGSYKHVRHSFMIRHPAKAISSLYYKSCIDNEKTGYTHFDPAEAGYTAMAAMMAHLDEQPDCPPYAIIDADDLLEDPAGMMEAYCDALALPFDESMLSWQPGPVPELASPCAPPCAPFAITPIATSPAVASAGTPPTGDVRCCCFCCCCSCDDAAAARAEYARMRRAYMAS